MRYKIKFKDGSVKEFGSLCGEDLVGADLHCADLRGAKLSGANLCEADLSLADLRFSDLRGAILCRTESVRCGSAGHGHDRRQFERHRPALRNAGRGIPYGSAP